MEIVLIVVIGVIVLLFILVNSYSNDVEKSSGYLKYSNSDHESWRNDSKNTFSDAENARQMLQYDFDRINSYEEEKED